MLIVSSVPCRPLLHTRLRFRIPMNSPPIRRLNTVHAFTRGDVDGFAKRVASSELWRKASGGFELFIFETSKTAERLDRTYEISRRLSEVSQSAADRARRLDRDLEINQRWRTFSLEFQRNLPRYRRQVNDYLDTPLGRSFSTIFFLWFVLSGWLFQFLIVLPLAGLLVIGVVANTLVLEGECPACKSHFIGYKNQTVRCASCRNIVWQPQDRNNDSASSSRSQPDIIDVEFKDK